MCINIYFIEWSWTWTAIAFFLSWVTSAVPSPRTGRHVAKWVTGTNLIRKACIFLTGTSVGHHSLTRAITPPYPENFVSKVLLFSPAGHPWFFHGFLRPGTWMAGEASFKKRSWCRRCSSIDQLRYSLRQDGVAMSTAIREVPIVRSSSIPLARKLE